MKNSSLIITKQSQESFLQNVKKNQTLIEEIRICEKELLKRGKKFQQNLFLTCQSGIHLSEHLKLFQTKFEKSDVSMIQRVCSCLQQTGEIILNFIQILDQIQMDIEEKLTEPIKNLIEGELQLVTNGPKLDSIKITSQTNPKVSQVIQNTQMAMNKFELESLNIFINLYDTFDSIQNGMISLNVMKENVDVARKQKDNKRKRITRKYEKWIKFL